MLLCFFLCVLYSCSCFSTPLIRSTVSCLYFADNELYSGTVADFSGSDPIIYRETLQTEQYDSLSLNGNEMRCAWRMVF